jgi:hypothetical protein
MGRERPTDLGLLVLLPDRHDPSKCKIRCAFRLVRNNKNGGTRARTALYAATDRVFEVLCKELRNELIAEYRQISLSFLTPVIIQTMGK